MKSPAEMSDFFYYCCLYDCRRLQPTTLPNQGSSLELNLTAILPQHLALSQFLFCFITFRYKNVRQRYNIGIFIAIYI